MISSMLKEWPCLIYGDYILEELRMVLGVKNDKEMEKLVRRSDIVMQALVKLTPEEKKQSKVNNSTIYDFVYSWAYVHGTPVKRHK